jgi:hypothetical protein
VVEADPATTTIDDDGNGTDASSGNGTDASGGNGTDTGDGDATGSTDESADGNETDTADGDETDDSAGSETDATDNGTDADGPTNDAPSDEQPGSPGLLPLPFGTREALGGTVLVGAVHLLGHWV